MRNNWCAINLIVISTSESSDTSTDRSFRENINTCYNYKTAIPCFSGNTHFNIPAAHSHLQQIKSPNNKYLQTEISRVPEHDRRSFSRLHFWVSVLVPARPVQVHVPSPEHPCDSVRGTREHHQDAQHTVHFRTAQVSVVVAPDRSKGSVFRCPAKTSGVELQRRSTAHRR